MICELFKRHITQQQANVVTEEIRSTMRKEERIIDTLEPVLNQHKLIMDPKIWEWDYASNPNEAPEKRLEYMLGSQWSRLTRDRNSLRHDDRIDALAMGVQWFVDAIAQSAHKAQAQRKNLEWQAMINAFEEHPHEATDALVLGRSFQSLKHLGTTKVWDW